MKYHEILDCIRWRFHDHLYRLHNSYIFHYDWESDVFSINKGGFAHEFEIKMSLSDFRADFKKSRKHRIMSGYKSGWFVDRSRNHNTWDKALGMKVEYSSIHPQEIKNMRVPNRFFYVCPDGLIPEKDVPHYAGLIYCKPGDVGKVIKSAPLIHKSRHDYRKILCDKFYHKYLSEKHNYDILKNEVEYLRSQNKNQL